MLRRVDVVSAAAAAGVTSGGGPFSEEASRHLGVFYTGLYRALTFPRKLHEETAEGKVAHYRYVYVSIAYRIC